MSQLTLKHGLIVEGTTSVTNTADSTSTTTGAFKVSGGVGIEKSLVVGSGLKVIGPSTFTSTPLEQSVILNPLSSGDTGIRLVSSAATNNSYIDFGYIGVDFKGRITYNNNTDIFKINTSGTSVDKLTINSTGDITVLGYISANVLSTGNNLSPIGTAAHFRFSGSTISNNIIIEAGANSSGGNIGLSNINFNGYFSTSDQRIDTSKNRWRVSVDQEGSNDLFSINTFNGTINSDIIQINTALQTTFSTTTSSTSSSTGAVVLSGGLSITNSTDAVDVTNGGSITTAGGAAINKSLFVGSTAIINNQIVTRNGTSSEPGILHYVLQTSNLNRFALGLVNTESGSNNGSDFRIFRYADNASSLTNILTITRSTGNIKIDTSTASSSSSFGSIILSGGLSINNNTDAVSITNGGSITTSGGVAIAKKLFVGGLSVFQNAIDMNSTKIINLADPTNSQDSATKSYVDSVAQGLSIKNSVIAATIGPNNLNTDFQNGSILDGIALSTGDRVLIKDQSSSVENGIYIVQASGVPLRSSDFASSTSQSGSFVFVDSGTTNDNSGFVVTSNPPNDVVGTNSINFTQFSGAGQITAGTGLSKSGNTLSVNSSLTNVTQVGTLTSLTVNGSISGVSLNLSGLTASQAVLTDGSKNLISVATSGTGNVVLQTSPSLVTPNIGAATATSLTISSSTFTSTGNDIFINANSNSVYLRNTSGSANGEFESSTSIFKFRNSSNTANILDINKTTSVSTFTGKIVSNNTTAATDSNTGSIVLSGGLALNITNDASSTTNGGSITTQGGVAIAKQLFIGGPTVTLNNTTNPSHQITNGSETTVFGLASSSGIFSNNSIAGDTVISSADTKSLILQSGTGNAALTITSGNIVNIPGTTASSSSTTGSLTLLGGIGINNTTDATSVSNGGSFTTAGGAAIAKTLYVGGQILIHKTSIIGATVNENTNTVSGYGLYSSYNNSGSNLKAYYGLDGVGYFEIETGSALIATNNINANVVIAPNLKKVVSISASTTAPALTVKNIGTINTGLAIASFIDSSSNEKITIIDESSSQPPGIVSSTSSLGLGLYSRSAGPINFYTTSSDSLRASISSSGIFNIPGTTASTSSTTGILTLSGGIGINNSTDATSSVSGGSFTTSGGAAIAKSLYSSTNISFGDNSAYNRITTDTGISYIECGTSLTSDSRADLRFTSMLNGTINMELFGTTGNLNVRGAISGSSIATPGTVNITNITDATSSVSGGSFTTSGGAAIAKSLYVGEKVSLDNSTGSIVTNTRINTLGYMINSLNTGNPMITDLKVINKRTRTSRQNAFDCVNTWTSRSAATVNQWVSLVWSSELSLFAAVSDTGTGNRVMTSPDGISWTTRSSAADNSWTSIVWAAELSLFVVVGTSGTGNRVMTSSDGISWTTRASAADNSWTSIVWAPELLLLVAVSSTGTGNRVMTSSDGSSWTTRTSAADNSWSSVAWSPELNLFVAVSTGTGTFARTMTSNDAITWTSQSTSDDGVEWNFITWSPELYLFVMFASNGSANQVQTSSDGTSWTLRNTPSDGVWESAVWSPELSIFVAISSNASNRIMISSDGITWTSKSIQANSWKEIVWSPELSIFVSVSIDGANRVITSNLGIPNSKSTLLVNPAYISVNNTNGNLSLLSNTASSSSTSGSLTLAGGIGINNTTNSTSLNNGGSFTTAGGAAIAKSLYVGAGLRVSGPTSFPITSNVQSITLNPQSNGDSAVEICAASSNSLSYVDFTYSNADYRGRIAYSHNTDTFTFYTGTAVRATLNGIGVLNITGTTASTSSTTGSLTLSGGIGINNTTDASSASNGGSFTTAGGAAIAKSLYIGGQSLIHETSINGAIINQTSNTVSGYGLYSSYVNSGSNKSAYYGLDGVGFFDIEVGSALIATNNINANVVIAPNVNRVVTISSSTTTPAITVKNAGTINTGLTIASFTNSSIEKITIIDETTSPQKPPGIVSPTAGLGLGLYSRASGPIDFYTTSSDTLRASISSSGIFNIPGTTASTSSTTGILTLSGGIGINNSTDASSSSNGGSFTTAGGAAIAKSLYVGGSLSKTSGTFDIRHPDPVKRDKNYRLRHSFVESNTRGDNLYRYQVKTENLKAEITLPSYFHYLNENPQVFISSVDVFGLSKGIINEEGKVYIQVSVDGTYNVLVIGTRKDEDAVKNFDSKGVEYLST